MCLLDTKAGQFVDHNPHTDIYAILSPTWVHDSEQTYQDLRGIQRDYGPDGRRLSTTSFEYSSPTTPTSHSSSQPSLIWDDPRLSPKIRSACATARRDGFRYVWIDSCCIDKTNSTELSEAINSMYAWYRDSKICYAYLADVPTRSPRQNSHFSRSRWFSRGWTLQELIAPREVVFLSEEWEYLGTKYSLASLIWKITRIDPGVLKHKVSLDLVSVAKRMSWASQRETTRPEDRAYSLLGIFNIHMPTLYGEGPQAFRRLQEEIPKRIPDQSLFAWGNVDMCPVPAYFLKPPNPSASLDPAIASASEQEDGPPILDLTKRPYIVKTSSLFATSPRDFKGSNYIESVDNHDSLIALLGEVQDVPVQDYSLSPYGMRTQLPLLSLANKAESHPEDYDYYIAILACTDQRRRDLGLLLGRLCVIHHYNSKSPKVHQLYATIFQMQNNGSCGLFVLPRPQYSQNHGLLQHIHVQTVYLPHPDRELPRHEDHDFKYDLPRNLGLNKESTKVHFPKWAEDRLRTQGYNVHIIPRTEDDPCPNDVWITLSKGENALTITYRYMQVEPRGDLIFLAKIYIFDRQSHSLVFLSQSRRAEYGHDTPKHTPYLIMIQHMAYGGRSCNRLIPLRLGNRDINLRLVLELVSAACYHLQLSIEPASSAKIHLPGQLLYDLEHLKRQSQQPQSPRLLCLRA